MPSGTGLDKVAEAFPERTFDVGIAEQHAVTFAAGLAAQGIGRSARSIRPSSSAPTTRWSTTWPSRTCRYASRWTAPGWSAPTGRRTPAASTSLISARLPNFVVMAAADEAELVHMVHTMALHDSGPDRGSLSAWRRQGRGASRGAEALEIGKGRIVRHGSKVAILSLGTRLAEAKKAADQLEAKGLSTTVADLRFAKPLDSELIRKLLTTHEVAVTVEEASIGGLGAHVLTMASDEGLLDAG